VGEPESGESGRAGITVVKTPGLRVVVEVLEEGERLAGHQAPGPITLQVLEGEIRVEAGLEVVYVRKGELVALPSPRPHSIEAVRDSSLLLTIAPERSRGDTE
jgi:quercetin dioxygenase-like cupin family protein